MIASAREDRSVTSLTTAETVAASDCCDLLVRPDRLKDTVPEAVIPPRTATVRALAVTPVSSLFELIARATSLAEPLAAPLMATSPLESLELMLNEELP